MQGWVASSLSPLPQQGRTELKVFLRWIPSDVAESRQNMRLSFAGAFAVFRGTPCIKDASQLSILLLSRQLFCGLRSIQSGSAVGRLLVSERSFSFW